MFGKPWQPGELLALAVCRDKVPEEYGEFCVENISIDFQGGGF